MSRFINVAVIGCTGYVGIELVKILSRHKKVKIKALSSETNAGKNFSKIFPEFKKK